jgi:hypothetical protein
MQSLGKFFEGEARLVSPFLFQKSRIFIENGLIHSGISPKSCACIVKFLPSLLFCSLKGSARWTPVQGTKQSHLMTTGNNLGALRRQIILI